VCVVREPRRVVVEVASGVDGPAVARAPGTGLGLVGLQERVELAGGTFVAGIDPRRAQFVVAAELPLPAPQP
jgi:signal transduction histidine kinase